MTSPATYSKFHSYIDSCCKYHRMSKDELQDVYYKLYKSKLDPNKINKSYVAHIVYSVKIDNLRKHNKMGFVQPLGNVQSVDCNDAKEGLKITKQLLSNQFSYYQILIDHANGIKINELAIKYCLPQGTIKNRIYKMRQFLKTKIKLNQWIK